MEDLHDLGLETIVGAKKLGLSAPAQLSLGLRYGSLCFHINQVCQFILHRSVGMFKQDSWRIYVNGLLWSVQLAR